MSTVNVPLTDEYPCYEFRVDLEEVGYICIVKYNERADRWTLDIYDIDRNPLRLGQMLLPGYPLFRGAAGRVDGFPLGKFYLLDMADKGRTPGETGLGKDFKLWYEESE